MVKIRNFFVLLQFLVCLLPTSLLAQEVLEANKYTLSETWYETPVVIETYFSSEGNVQLEGFLNSDFKKCHDYQVESNKKNGQGYQVMKSLGGSDDYIVYGGVISCMESKEWGLNKLVDGKFKKARYMDYEIKEEELLTQDELKRLNNTRQSIKEWYKKYSPNVLEH